jgi:hypothetical protein
MSRFKAKFELTRVDVLVAPVGEGPHFLEWLLRDNAEVFAEIFFDELNFRNFILNQFVF